MPIADVQHLRRISATFPEPSGPSKTLPRLPRPESSGSPPRGPIKRRTAEIQVPGAFPSFDIEQNLDDHMRMIEVEFVTRRQSKGTYSDVSAASPRDILKPLSNNRARRTDKIGRRASLSRSKPELREQQSITNIGNESQGCPAHDLKLPNHRQRFTPSSGVEKTSRPPKKPDSRRTEHTNFVPRDHTTSADIRPGTAQPTASKLEPDLKGFRRLSLGDISSGLEGLFR
jgi:hypothetical protein